MKAKSVFLTSIVFFCGILCLSCQKINPDELTGDYVYAEIDGKQYLDKDEVVILRPNYLMVSQTYFTEPEGSVLSFILYDTRVSPTFLNISKKKAWYSIGFDFTLLDEDIQLSEKYYYGNGGTRERVCKRLDGGSVRFIGVDGSAYVTSAWITIDSITGNKMTRITMTGRFEINATIDGIPISVRNGKYNLPLE